MGFVVFGLQTLVVAIGRVIVGDWSTGVVVLGVAASALYQADLTRRSNARLRGR